jgi:carboxyl-terminal processing protease
MRKLLLVGCAALVLGGSAAVATSQTPRNETFRMLELFGDVVGIVEQAYVVPVDNKKLIEAALAGMMTALDPHSNYLPPSNYDELRERTEGQYSGVGLTITSEGGLVKVISPMDESPAARAGVQAGDVISAIEGQNAAGLTVSQVSEKLRGAAGTSVRVTFLRDGEEPREVALTREVIRIEAVTGRLEGDFGYLRISTFNENTGRELRQTIEKVAPTNSRIMIFGPSGSGKELVARMIHKRSARSVGPFVSLNAAAITPDRMEMALFGTEGTPGQPRRIGALRHGLNQYATELLAIEQ